MQEQAKENPSLLILLVLRNTNSFNSPHTWLWLNEEPSPAQPCGTNPIQAFFSLCSAVPPWHKLCRHHGSHCVLLPHLPTIQTWLEIAQWKPVLSLFIPGWDRDALECGPISLYMHQNLVGLRDGEASYAKGKAGYKEGGKYEELKAI